MERFLFGVICFSSDIKKYVDRVKNYIIVNWFLVIVIDNFGMVINVM